MPSKYPWQVEIGNDYLRVSKTVKGYTRAEVEMKAQNQLEKWAEQEARKRDRETIADQKEKAIFDTKEALEEIDKYKNILSKTLSVDDKLEWTSLYKKEKFKQFRFKDEPTYEQVAAKLGVPKRTFLEKFMRSRERRRLELESKANEVLAGDRRKFEQEKSGALAQHQEEKSQFLKEQNEYNGSIDQLRADFETGKVDAIEKYVRLVLERSVYPDAMSKEFEVQYDQNSKSIIISYMLPSPDELPKIIQYKFVASRRETDTVEMKKKDFDSFYECTILQICLRTIHEVFESVYTNHVEGAVFNGWVNGVDLATGKDFTSCIISVSASREAFKELDLSRVDPKQCMRNLKGLIAGPLALLAPVKPILDINREDDRFIESRDILAQMNPNDNLATMEWPDFEHLVRELFSKYFSDAGAEVKVTQSSRDKGVDAIAFDPDPIKGGKFVIQAKRYNDVVPVSAVRDLYGTMINEGASRGILVTTSYYGHDSRDFVKDKPISLIDGSNLVHMFKEYGYDLYIKLQKGD